MEKLFSSLQISEEKLDDSVEVTRIDYDDGTHYHGQVKNGLRHGFGTQAYKYGNGMIHKGSWVNDNLHGFAESVLPKFQLYKGMYKNGLFNGPGRFTWSGGHYLEGTFKDGWTEVEGTKTYTHGQIERGVWRSMKSREVGKLSGLVETTFPTGQHYKGMYENDMYNGPGKFTWSDGSYLEGTFTGC